MVSSKLVDWQRVTFDEAFTDITAKANKVDQSEFLSSGNYPIVDQGQNFIAGYTDNEELVWEDDLPVVIFGDHTRILKYVDFPFVLGADGTKVLKPNKEIFPLFAYYQLLNFDIPSAGYSRHFKFLKDFSFQYPSMDEQKRIAFLLKRADRLRQLRGTAHELGDSLLQSVFLEMFGGPETNPKKWKLGHIRDLCEKILDCPHETPIHSETETEYASIRSSDIQNGHLDFSTTKYVSYEVYKRRIERGTPMPGDVVYCREGARFGNAARIPENLNKKVCLGQRMMSFRVNPQKATSEFLWAILESPSIYKQAVNMVGGSAAPHVNVQDIKKFNIIIPPLILQEEFAGVVARVESLRGRMSEAGRQVKGLFESLLAEAFAQ